VLTTQEFELPPTGGGLIVVGSYVPKTTSQLEALLALPGIVSCELNVTKLLDVQAWALEIERATRQVEAALSQGQDVVLYTSRQLITGADAVDSLAIGQRISGSLVSLVQKLQARPRYVLAKGGITSSDVATQGLGIQRAAVMGQILPGVPVWRTGPESRFPGLVYIVFPGNVGDQQALVAVVEKLQVDR
jgi:uncharacterized protein YgbK (DUF1537 family)